MGVLFKAAIDISSTSSRAEGVTSEAIIPDMASPASSSLLKLAIPIALTLGRCLIRKVASTIMPRVPSEPTISLSSW